MSVLEARWLFLSSPLSTSALTRSHSLSFGSWTCLIQHTWIVAVISPLLEFATPITTPWSPDHSPPPLLLPLICAAHLLTVSCSQYRHRATDSCSSCSPCPRLPPAAPSHWPGPPCPRPMRGRRRPVVLFANSGQWGGSGGPAWTQGIGHRPGGTLAHPGGDNV